MNLLTFGPMCLLPLEIFFLKLENTAWPPGRFLWILQLIRRNSFGDGYLDSGDIEDSFSIWIGDIWWDDTEDILWGGFRSMCFKLYWITLEKCEPEFFFLSLKYPRFFEFFKLNFFSKFNKVLCYFICQFSPFL